MPASKIRFCHLIVFCVESTGARVAGNIFAELLSESYLTYTENVAY